MGTKSPQNSNSFFFFKCMHFLSHGKVGDFGSATYNVQVISNNPAYQPNRISAEKFATLGLSRKIAAAEKRFGIRSNFPQIFPPPKAETPALSRSLPLSFSFSFSFSFSLSFFFSAFSSFSFSLAFSTVSASRLCFFFAGLPAKITLYDNTIKISRENTHESKHQSSNERLTKQQIGTFMTVCSCVQGVNAP